MSSTPRLWTLLAALIAFALCAWSGLWGYAGSLVIGPERQVATWQRQGWTEDMASWGDLFSGLQRATRINPFNADYPARLGAVLMWRSYLARQSRTAMRNEATLAAGWYRQATALRPTSGVLWADRAEAVYIANGLDAEVLQSVERAAVFGPWDSVVHGKLSRLTIPNWANISESLRPLMLKTMANAMKMDTTLQSPHFVDEQIIDLAVRHGWVEYLEPLLTYPRQRESLSRKLEQHRPRRS